MSEIETQRLLDYYRSEHADLMAAVAAVTSYLPKPGAEMPETIAIPSRRLQLVRDVARGKATAVDLQVKWGPEWPPLEGEMLEV